MLYWVIYKYKYEKTIQVINKLTVLSKFNVNNNVFVSLVLTYVTDCINMYWHQFIKI